ncbi:D-alanyl-D-alanine carboxypeptidase family protein [Microbacterium sorbitolivorans]|uniref:D-alanyl-D-alanine carboxypeptidase family protein n=1 Tax=Microbacterium sorbitolivorans TaxID=1867410 RepID=A0A367XZB5_9MICO|nr:D-alanyl-D-alanine carboxypeptidase family protein [Microbacterium sorbitolivorans]
MSACVMIVAGAALTTGAGSAGAAPQPSAAAAPTAQPTTDPSAEPTATADPVDEDFCNDAVRAAIDSGDAEAVVVAAGGGEAFREGVVSGAADGCIALNHPAWSWVVVNKQRPIEPIDFAPATVSPALYSPIGATLTQAAADALDELATAVDAAGQGQIGLFSGYRDYTSQGSAHDSLVDQMGEEAAEQTSARPGYSEHQLGLAADLVSCEGQSCGTIYDFGATPQGQWVDENAWKYGFIVRYGEHGSETTGYESEPWHLRYVGVELAKAYVDGGYETYEDFWGLPAATEYAS